MTQRTIHDTICQRGYTAKVRPPRKVTDATKRRLAEGLPDSPQDYELDHLIPLGLGGHPTSPENLWLQSWPEAAIKDRDELRLPRELCAGQLAARYRLPAMYEWHEIVEDGGFMSYGPNRVELSRRVAVYVDRILKGRFSGRAGDQVRAGRQCEDRRSPRPDHSALRSSAG